MILRVQQMAVGYFQILYEFFSQPQIMNNIH